MKLLDLFCSGPTCPTCKKMSGPEKNVATTGSPHRPHSENDMEAANPWEAHWRSVCSDYWRGCWRCPDGDVKKLVFCRRYLEPDWAHERAQGRLLQ